MDLPRLTELAPPVAGNVVPGGNFVLRRLDDARFYAVRAAILESAADGQVGETRDHALDDAEAALPRRAQSGD